MNAVHRRLRQLKIVANALLHRDRPILAQIVPTRRCNLACSYCNEYDRTSEPVPLAAMLSRIDHLARLGTGIVTISGGEPLLHPELDAIIVRIRGHGMIAGLITNGFYLSPTRIDQLNQAGLEYLQISLDSVDPDGISHKSLKSLDVKLRYLADGARFHVNVNPVVGAGIKKAGDILVIARRARELGFTMTVGILHDDQGQLKALTADEMAAYEAALSSGQSLLDQLANWLKESAGTGSAFRPVTTLLHAAIKISTGQYAAITDFQQNLVEGKPNRWHCLSGARYLYICENGLVSYCSQKRGLPGTALADYGVRQIREQFAKVKPCAPFCTIGCVHRASSLDNMLRSIGFRHF